MTCAIVGDSIALGTAEAEGLAARYRPPCSVNAGRDHTHPLSYVPIIAEIQRELKP